MAECQFRILDYIYPFLDNVSITGDSENPDFPVSNFKQKFRSKVVRSGGSFKIDSTNNKINFKESGAGPELTGVLTPGTYSVSGLAAELKTALEAAGAETYTVSQSSTNGKWTISHAGAFLSILWATGTNSANSIGSAIGFDTSTDDTGSTSYTGAATAIHTEEGWVFDLKTAENIDTFVMLWDNRLGINLSDEATITLQANATNLWTAPALNQAITIDNTNKIASHFFTTNQHYRYWRVKVVDPKNADLYVEIGKILFGKATQMERVPSIGFDFKKQDRSNNFSNQYGNTYSDIYPPLKRLEFDLKVFNKSDLDILINVYDRVGNHDPIFVAFDSEETVFNKNLFSLYGLIKGQLQARHRFSQYFDSNLSVEEIN